MVTLYICILCRVIVNIILVIRCFIDIWNKEDKIKQNFQSIKESLEMKVLLQAIYLTFKYNLTEYAGLAFLKS